MFLCKLGRINPERKIDLENVEKLKKFDDTTVVLSFSQLKNIIFKRKKNV